MSPSQIPGQGTALEDVDVAEISQLTDEEVNQELLDDFLSEFGDDPRQDIDEDHAFVSVEVRVAFIDEDGTLTYGEEVHSLVMPNADAVRGMDVIDVLFSCDCDEDEFDDEWEDEDEE